MDQSWLISGVALAYLVACLVIGLRAGKGSSDSAAGYVAGDRALGTLVDPLENLELLERR